MQRPSSIRPGDAHGSARSSTSCGAEVLGVIGCLGVWQAENGAAALVVAAPANRINLKRLAIVTMVMRGCATATINAINLQQLQIRKLAANYGKVHEPVCLISSFGIRPHCSAVMTANLRVVVWREMDTAIRAKPRTRGFSCMARHLCGHSRIWHAIRTKKLKLQSGYFGMARLLDSPLGKFDKPPVRKPGALTDCRPLTLSGLECASYSCDFVHNKDASHIWPSSQAPILATYESPYLGNCQGYG